MTEHPTLSVQSRTDGGSRESRRLRRRQRIPGILYGHGDPLPVSLDATEFRRQVPPGGYGSLIVTLQLDGKSAGNALVKSVQASAAARQIISVDLLRVSATDRLHVSVPIALTGDAPGVHQGGVLEQTLHALNLRCSPDAVPERIIHDLGAMSLGASIHVKHLSLPPGSDLLDNPEEVVAVMLAPTVPAAEEVFEVVEESEGESEGETA